MKTLLFFALFVSIEFIATGQCKLQERTNKKTEKKEAFTLLNLGGSNTMIWFSVIKVDSNIYAEVQYYRDISKSFEIKVDCPFLIKLENNTQLLMKQLTADHKTKATFEDFLTGGWESLNAKSGIIRYPITKEQILMLIESKIIEAKLYFYAEKNINSTDTDELGTYFRINKIGKNYSKFVEGLKCIIK
jgi:hypothetical protein